MEPLLGSILLVPYNFTPTGWLACNGQLLQINQYQALFALLGTTYGGDGRATFALPNLDASSLQQGLQYIIAIQGVFPSRN